MSQLQNEVRHGQHRAVYNSVCVSAVTTLRGLGSTGACLRVLLVVNRSFGLDLAVPSRVNLPFLHTQAESGAHKMDYYPSFSSPGMCPSKLPGQCRVYHGTQLQINGVNHWESAGTEKSSRMLPFQGNSSYGPINVSNSFPNQVLVHLGMCV